MGAVVVVCGGAVFSGLRFSYGLHYNSVFPPSPPLLTHCSNIPKYLVISYKYETFFVLPSPHVTRARAVVRQKRGMKTRSDPQESRELWERIRQREKQIGFFGKNAFLEAENEHLRGCFSNQRRTVPEKSERIAK